MRIAYVLTSLGIGGAERQVLAIADRMAAHNHDVAILVLRPPIAAQWPTTLPVTHLNLRKNPAAFCAALFRARRFIREFRPGLLHSHSFHANIFARLLRVLPAPQVLSTIHNVYEGGRLRMLAYRLTDFLSARTTAVSAAAANRFVRVKAVPGNKITVIPNAIDTAEFAPDHHRRAQTRATLAAGDSFVWLAAGRIVPAKDFPNLLRAFVQVRAVQPTAQLWIAGEPHPGIRRLSAPVSSKGSMEGVRWLGLRRDIPALLDACDAFVLSSAWEGMPLVVAEAMAMEKPVVATDVGGVRELLGPAADLVPAKSADRLAAAMLQLIRQPAQARAQTGRAARTRILTRFSLDTRAAEWDSLYRSLVCPAHLPD